MEVEINPAQWTVVVRLAQDDGHLPVERNTVTKMRTAVVVGLDGLLHQPGQRFLAVLRRLVDANNVFLKGLECLDYFRFEHLDRQVHGAEVKESVRGIQYTG